MKILIFFLLTSTSVKAAEPVSRIEEAVGLIWSNRPGSDNPKTGRGKIRSFEFTEAEVNEFTKQLIRRKGGKASNSGISIKSVEVGFRDKRILQMEAVAVLSPAALNLLGLDQDAFLIKTLKKCLGMDNSLYVECLFSSARGTALIKVLKVKIKGIPLPDAALQRLTKLIGDRQRPPLDFGRPFPLPCDIEKIDVLPGRLGLLVRAR
ncbi:MAG TPA: hypothetical protein DCL44_06305 [Elusimicrobia bacterium]|nr:hypothetical protein [Elusimicrobiota bacterium]